MSKTTLSSFLLHPGAQCTSSDSRVFYGRPGSKEWGVLRKEGSPRGFYSEGGEGWEVHSHRRTDVIVRLEVSEPGPCTTWG